MVFQNNILAGSSGQSTAAYDVNYSCRFDGSARLTNANGTPTSTTTATIAFWFKIGVTGVDQAFFGEEGFYEGLAFLANGKLYLVHNGAIVFTTTQTFRDPTAWYHCVCVYDTTESTDTNRAKLYINGVQVTAFAVTTWPTEDEAFTAWNTSGVTNLVADGHSTYANYNGYLSEFHSIDGIAYGPTTFGEFDDNNVWRPIEVTGVTYGTNGFYLDFADSSALGNDVSGNNNDCTSSGLASTDQMLDTPTKNFCVWNAAYEDATSANYTLSNGNLTLQYVSSSDFGYPAHMFVSSGKWYFEIEAGSAYDFIGIVSDTTVATGNMSGPAAYTPNNFSAWAGDGAYAYRAENGNSMSPTAGSSYGDAYTDGDVIGVALDLDNGAIWYSKNDTWQDSATIAEIEAGTTTNAAETSGLTAGIRWTPALCFSATHTTVFLNCGQIAFAGTAPSGFNKINTSNLATPTIVDGTAHFQTTLYTGNGSVRNIDQTGNSTFQPDFVWIKNRDTTDNNMLIDAPRGVTKEMNTNVTDVEDTDTDGLTSFDADGFGLGTGAAGYNDNTEKFVAWQWKAGGGAGSSNTDGSINTTTTTVNTTSGFSCSTFVGTGSNATVGHGLGVVPTMIIIKCRNDATGSGEGHWHTYHAGDTAAPETDYMVMNLTTATTDDANVWQDTAPTSTVFSIGTSARVNVSTNLYVAYCFADVEGFSKFGGYEGNNKADGSYVNLGFSPAWLLIKDVDEASTNWNIWDIVRSPYNRSFKEGLRPNSTQAEHAASIEIDFLANGFKLRDAGGDINNAVSYLFCAFAEYPFGGEDLSPATAI